MKPFNMQGAIPGTKLRRMAGAAAALALVVVFAGVTWLRSEPLVQAEPVGPVLRVQAAQSRSSALAPASLRRIGGHRTAARFLQFEPNRGQAPQAVRYLSHGPAHRVEIFDDGMALSEVTPRSTGEGGAGASAADASVRLRFVGARSAAGFEAREPDPGQAHYLVGDDASKWIRNVPGYRQLRRPELYPGIDLVYYSREGALEFDLVVKPGADPSRIRMHVGGARPPVIEASGDLLLDGAGGSLRLHRPVLYQNIAGEKKVLDARYVLRGERSLGFALPDYDKRYPLVIDPVFKLLYSTYLTGFHDDQVGAMVLDAQSNAYVVGGTSSDDFVVSGNALQTGKSTTGLQYNIVLTKFDASGTLIYSTYLGGSGSDIATAIAVDAAGNAYVTGNTTSRDFPVTAGAQQPTFTGSLSAFLAVVSPDGSVLAHSTYYGGSGSVQATAIALDAGEAPVIAGSADAGLVTTPGAYKTTLAAGDAAFVARFSAIAAGAPRLLAASYYGVDNPQANATARGNHAFSMALDASGAPWLTGQAFTTNLPTTAAAVQSAPAAMSPSCAPGPAPLNSFAFVARLSADLASLTYASYLTGATEPAGGAACSEFGHSLALDSSGNVYLTGATGSGTFPTTAGAVQATFPSAAGVASYTGFVTKMKPDGSAILWSTYLGGNGGNTFPAVIALDPANAAVWTTSVTGGGSNYPVSVGAVQATHGGGGADAGLVQLDAATGALKYSTFLGGASADVGLALGVDAGGTTFVAGNTFSTDFPVTANAFQKTYRPDFYGGADWFFSVLGGGTIGQVRPAAVGNGGDATLTISGAGFQDGASCRLDSGASTIAAFQTSVSADGTKIVCRFQLAAAAAGSYDVSVVNPDASSVRRTAALTVRATPDGTVPSDLWIDLVGRPTIRAGVSSDFAVTYGNRGPNDVYLVPVLVSWPVSSGLTVQVDREPMPDLKNGGSLSFPDTALSTTIGDRVYMSLAVPFIGSGQTASFPLHVTGTSVDADYDLRVEMSQPEFQSIADMIALRDGRATASIERLRRLGLQENNKDARFRMFAHGITSGEFANCLGTVVTAVASNVPGGPCVQAVASAATAAAVAAAANAANGKGKPVVSNNELIAGAIINAVPCAGSFFPPALLIVAVAQAGGNLANIASACGNIIEVIATGAINGRIRGSRDPNDKTGASGDGTPVHYVAGRPLPYQIAFENVATASLPAAKVVVTDVLDARAVDLSTLTLGDVSFGNHQIAVPAGLSSYATTYAVDATLSVRIQGSLNRTTGVLKWTFDTIDPATGLPPSDPTLGFLPPDTDGVRGQGLVSFVVSPLAGIANGAAISNQASIVFDSNAAILTPTWINTIDTTAPSSKVQSLTGKPGTTSFDVVWTSPADSGSAVRRYSIFVADNGGSYVLWQKSTTATTAVYDGSSGHSYAFYAMAVDGAGNAEAAKSSAEATISVNGAFPDPTVGTSESSGGCTIGGGDSQRDASLPLLLIIAGGLLLIERRRATTKPRRAAD